MASRISVRAIAVTLSAVPALLLMGAFNTTLAATDPGLATASSFAALAGSTVTNTGSSVITGNLGVSPGSAVTGFPPGILNGTQHISDAVALQAQSDLTTAYNSAAGQPVTQDLTGQDLGNKLLTPGVYHFSSSAQLTGPLTLDGQGAGHAIFIFQIGSTLTTASASSVTLINGASGCDVWWQIGSSATLGTGTTFRGNLMALTSITLTTGANIPAGRALARNGALTLDTNNISIPAGCAGSSSPGSSGGSSSSPSPSPSGSSSGTPPSDTSLGSTPGTSRFPGAPPAGPQGGPPGSPGGPPGVTHSPGVPGAPSTPDVSTPFTGRGLTNQFLAGVALILVGVLILTAVRRRSQRPR